MPDNHDIAVIGSGFAGSLFAMIARRLGHSVVLLERGRHPRVVIGESSTPLSNLLLEELARRYDLPAVQHLSKWGPWQEQYSHLPCGLKRGFSFFHHDLAQPEPWHATAQNHFLVAASPHNAIADTHWYRAGFDHFLLDQAQQIGVEYRDEWRAMSFAENDNGVALTGIQGGQQQAVHASFVVDATGPRGCLHSLLHLEETRFAHYPSTQALYSHFTGVRRAPQLSPARDGVQLPYPPEDAAVHHIFDGGWVWLLHFNNGITSSGVAATTPLVEEINIAEGHAAWMRLLARIPALADQFSSVKPVLGFTHLPQLSFRSGRVAGERWALLPSAAGFVDPLLSTGFPLTLLGISRLAAAIDDHWGRRTLAEQLHEYASQTHDELDATARLIAALYANMNHFAAFRAISLLYFAAASYAETARRLDKPHLAESFLLHRDPRFGPASRALLDRARHGIAPHESADFVHEVLRAIEPFDVAGLCSQRSLPWYPVEAADLQQAAWKLSASHEEIARMLERSGFYPALTR